LFYQKQTQIALWELEGVSCAAVLLVRLPPPRYPRFTRVP